MFLTEYQKRVLNDKKKQKEKILNCIDNIVVNDDVESSIDEKLLIQECKNSRSKLDIELGKSVLYKEGLSEQGEKINKDLRRNIYNTLELIQKDLSIIISVLDKGPNKEYIKNKNILSINFSSIVSGHFINDSFHDHGNDLKLNFTDILRPVHYSNQKYDYEKLYHDSGSGVLFGILKYTDKGFIKRMLRDMKDVSIDMISPEYSIMIKSESNILTEFEKIMKYIEHPSLELVKYNPDEDLMKDIRDRTENKVTIKTSVKESLEKVFDLGIDKLCDDSNKVRIERIGCLYDKKYDAVSDIGYIKKLYDKIGNLMKAIDRYKTPNIESHTEEEKILLSLFRNLLDIILYYETIISLDKEYVNTVLYLTDRFKYTLFERTVEVYQHYLPEKPALTDEMRKVSAWGYHTAQSMHEKIDKESNKIKNMKK